MGKKRVPISLRKPQSPDAAAAPVPSEAAPAAPEPETMAREAEPQAPPVAEPTIPEVAARLAEPPAPAVELESALVAHVAPEVPALVLASSDARLRRPVTIHLPVEIAEKLAVRCTEQGTDAVREAIEVVLLQRLTSRGAASSGAAAARERSPRGLVERVERLLELGRAVMTTFRVHMQSA